jgi:hypothetical protein
MNRGCRVLQTSGLQVENPQHRLGIRFFFFFLSEIIQLNYLKKNDWGKAEIWFRDFLLGNWKDGNV